MTNLISTNENTTKQFHLLKLPAPFKDMRNKSITLLTRICLMEMSYWGVII